MASRHRDARCWRGLKSAIVQEASPESHRARILSVYSLDMMGGMPIGSVLLGSGLWRVERAVVDPSSAGAG